MNDDENDWRPTFAQSCWVSLAIGLLVFIREWSGYNPHEPDLFSPRPIREIWGALPGGVALSFLGFQMARLLDWTKDRPWPYWIAYILALIAVVTLGVWLFVRVISS